MDLPIDEVGTAGGAAVRQLRVGGKMVPERVQEVLFGIDIHDAKLGPREAVTSANMCQRP
jgi:hypothetical protein